MLDPVSISASLKSDTVGSFSIWSLEKNKRMRTAYENYDWSDRLNEQPDGQADADAHDQDTKRSLVDPM